MAIPTAVSDLCSAAGSAVAEWPAMGPFPPLPVRCSPASPVTLPRCRDLNPCTNDVCSATMGCTNNPFPRIPRSAESFDFGFASVSGPSCSGEHSAGCADAVCDGAGACIQNPATFARYPAGTNSEVCYPGYENQRCASYQCNGAGGCLLLPRLDLPPSGTTSECGREPPDGSCYRTRCVNGACVENVPDSSYCETPEGCLPWQCAPFGTADLAFDPDVVRGCEPYLAECYIGGDPDGALDGFCVRAGPSSIPCTECDPARRAFEYSPSVVGTLCDDREACTVDDRCRFTETGRPCAGTPAVGATCDDGNDCTAGDTCGSFGTCEAGVCDLSVPRCQNEFCGAGG
jgi:hypothetical protein